MTLCRETSHVREIWLARLRRRGLIDWEEWFSCGEAENPNTKDSLGGES
jgi:hypothetical protein